MTVTPVETIAPEVTPEVTPEVLSVSTETQNNSPPAENQSSSEPSSPAPETTLPEQITVVAQLEQQAITPEIVHALSTDKSDYFPTDTVYISGVNFLSNSIFYLLSKLEPGDKITLFYQNKPYIYTVNQKKIVNPKDLSYLQNKTTVPTLTLMTCYPPGTDLKRLIIVAN